MKTVAKDELEVWKLRLREAIKNKDNQGIAECNNLINKCMNPKCSDCGWCVPTFDFTSMCRNMDSIHYNKINPEPCKKYVVR